MRIWLTQKNPCFKVVPSLIAPVIKGPIVDPKLSTQYKMPKAVPNVRLGTKILYIYINIYIYKEITGLLDKRLSKMRNIQVRKILIQQWQIQASLFLV